jgi:hypothetical protein
MIKKNYMLHGNNSLLLKYEVSVKMGNLKLKYVFKRVINIDSSALEKIQEFEREAEEKEKELKGKALVLWKIIKELEGKGYRLTRKDDGL